MTSKIYKYTNDVFMYIIIYINKMSERVVNMEHKNISINLRRIRESKGLSQAEIAERAEISRITYRNIESGSSIPKVSTLQNIAAGLGVKLQDLLMPARSLQNVRFRAAKKMNSRDSILNEVARWLDDFIDLENLLNDHKKNFVLKSVADDLGNMRKGEKRAKKAAELARARLGLKEDEPIRDIAGLLEKAGVRVYPLVLVSDDFFGLSVAEEDGGPAVIVNVWDRISVERWIFSAAHELGHLLLHMDGYNIAESSENEVEESEADVFASHFLMPEKVFNSEWEETAGLPLVDRVFKVKRIFQVSYKTVLYRLSDKIPSIWGKFYYAYKVKTGKSLGQKDEPEALSVDDFMQYAEVLRSKEPDSLSSSYFIEDRLSRLVRKAIEEEQITMSRGAEILNQDLETMRNIVASWV